MQTPTIQRPLSVEETDDVRFDYIPRHLKEPSIESIRPWRTIAGRLMDDPSDLLFREADVQFL